jgi:cytochrome c oxidase subunit 4
MSTTEHIEPATDDHGTHEHSDLRYVKVALALAIITGLEVSLTYMHFLGKAFLPVLLVLMVIKFVTVVLEFMHLRTDDRMFKMLFWSGLILAVVVYGAALLTFKVFSS